MVIRRLYELREDNDLKQRDVAAYLNVAQRTYSGYETGNIGPCNKAHYVL